MDGLEVGLHQMVRDRPVRGLSADGKLDAHFHEQRARGHCPERLGVAAIAGNERGGGRDVVGVILAIVEDRPGRAALIHRIEDVIGGGAIEGFDEGAGQVEYDAALSPLARLHDKVPQLRGLARTCGPDQHRVGLFEAPGIEYPGNRVRHMEPERCAGRDRKFGDRLWIEMGMGLSQFLRKLIVIVRANLADKHVAGYQHRPALVTLLEDVGADLLRQIHEPGG